MASGFLQYNEEFLYRIINCSLRFLSSAVYMLINAVGIRARDSRISHVVMITVFGSYLIAFDFMRKEMM